MDHLAGDTDSHFLRGYCLDGYGNRGMYFSDSIWEPAPLGVEPLSAMMVTNTVSRSFSISYRSFAKIRSIVVSFIWWCQGYPANRILRWPDPGCGAYTKKTLLCLFQSPFSAEIHRWFPPYPHPCCKSQKISGHLPDCGRAGQTTEKTAFPHRKYPMNIFSDNQLQYCDSIKRHQLINAGNSVPSAWSGASARTLTATTPMQRLWSLQAWPGIHTINTRLNWRVCKKSNLHKNTPALQQV